MFSVKYPLTQSRQLPYVLTKQVVQQLGMTSKTRLMQDMVTKLCISKCHNSHSRSCYCVVHPLSRQTMGSSAPL